jgi:uncharacterized protein YecE (DUF72 family)
MAGVRIGISGWTYPPWRGTFFPQGLKQRQELQYASRQVSSIEINGTFYSLQCPSSYAKWFAETPADFLFAVKGPRFITHIRRLQEPVTPLANFFASGVLQLGEKLGPILWQLPPSLPFQPERLETFLRLLPRDSASAIALARQHNDKVRHPWFESGPGGSIRHALEVRHPSFHTPGFMALLRACNVALVVADTAGKWPFMEDVTADFIYARLHGDAQLYVSGYTPAALDEWARKIRAWSRGQNPPGTKLTAAPAAARAGGRDVFCYFDNDVKTRAPYDAMNLAHLLGLGPKSPDAPPIESIAEEPRTVWPAVATSLARNRGKPLFPAGPKPRKRPKSSRPPRTKRAAGSP